jgi:hypothetical protein
MAHKLPRGRCVWCGKTRALDQEGRVRAHNTPKTLDRCPGSGQRPSATSGRTSPRPLGDIGAGMIRRPPP